MEMSGRENTNCCQDWRGTKRTLKSGKEELDSHVQVSASVGNTLKS